MTFGKYGGLNCMQRGTALNNDFTLSFSYDSFSGFYT
jgi:hypothetical protein